MEIFDQMRYYWYISCKSELTKAITSNLAKFFDVFYYLVTISMSECGLKIWLEILSYYALVLCIIQKMQNHGCNGPQ